MKNSKKPKTMEEVTGSKPGSFKKFLKKEKQNLIDLENERKERIRKSRAEKRPVIIQNAILNLESGEIIVSTHRHDYVTSYFEDGSCISADGGLDYFKRSFNCSGNHRYKDISLVESDCLNKKIDCLVWKTFGKNNEYAPDGKWFLLRDLTKSHLKAILKTEKQIKNTVYEKAIKEILKNK